PTDVKTTTGIGGGLDVDAGRAILSALVGGVIVVIGNALAAIVKIFNLDGARQDSRQAAERGRSQRKAGPLEFEAIEDKQVDVARVSQKDEIEGMRATGIGNGGVDITVNSTCERNVGGADQRTGRGVDMGFDAAA